MDAVPDRVAGAQPGRRSPAARSASRRLPAGGGPDLEGDGALRLTSNDGFSSGFILYQDALPLTAGLDVRFSFYAYNGTGADGFSFFVADGAQNLTQPGADGGSLGYAQRNDIAGLVGGYFGVGIDEYGNFSNDSENRGNGCASHAPDGLQPDHVSAARARERHESSTACSTPRTSARSAASTSRGPRAATTTSSATSASPSTRCRRRTRRSRCS